MLDNYPPGFDQSLLDGETREQQEALDAKGWANEAYKGCMVAVAAVLRNYSDAMADYPDSDIFDRISEILAECIPQAETPELCRVFCERLYKYATKQADSYEVLPQHNDALANAFRSLKGAA